LMMNPFSWLQMTNMISYQGLVRTFLKYTSNSDMTGMWWGLSPETAKAFKTLKKATAVLESLDLAGRAVAAPAFDIGKQIIVLTDDIGVENPLRKVTRLMQEAERDDANN
ncbi:hypothetical protein ACK3ZA_20705, partial [Aeromonas caviae]